MLVSHRLGPAVGSETLEVTFYCSLVLQTTQILYSDWTLFIAAFATMFILYLPSILPPYFRTTIGLYVNNINMVLVVNAVCCVYFFEMKRKHQWSLQNEQSKKEGQKNSRISIYAQGNGVTVQWS